MIGDSDGVVVVPAEKADEIAERALARFELEEDWDRRIEAGEPMSAVMGIKP